MTRVPATLKSQVEERAAGKCEYCRLSQVGQEARFHIDHILPTKLGGPTTADNLCLACVSCSLRKGAKTHAEDPLTGALACLFHPRQDKWAQHFLWQVACFMVSPRLAGRLSRLFPSTGH